MVKNLSAKDYKQSLELIQADILQTQLKAVSSVTAELTMLYWRIGKLIHEKINTAKWGTKVVAALAQDLKQILPGATGFSLKNLHYMRTFAEAYPDVNCAAVAAQLTSG